MLAKKYRFRGRTSLSGVFHRGEFTRSRSLALRFYAGDRENLRAAIVVSRKVSKSAVVRNRIRRRIYTFLEAELPKLKPGDLVVTCFDTELATASSAEARKHLSDILRQAKIYK